MTIQHGTVTIEATQLAPGVHAVISDKSGAIKKATFQDDVIHQVPWALIADTHVHFSQFQTRRN